MCTEFLTSGYEGHVMAQMSVCSVARKKINGERVFDKGELKIVDEVIQRYIECGWLGSEDEQKLEVLWQKAKNHTAVNRRRSKTGR